MLIAIWPGPAKSAKRWRACFDIKMISQPGSRRSHLGLASQVCKRAEFDATTTIYDDARAAELIVGTQRCAGGREIYDAAATGAAELFSRKMPVVSNMSAILDAGGRFLFRRPTRTMGYQVISPAMGACRALALRRPLSADSARDFWFRRARAGKQRFRAQWRTRGRILTLRARARHFTASALRRADSKEMPNARSGYFQGARSRVNAMPLSMISMMLERRQP